MKLLGQIGESFCCSISRLDSIDPYRRYLWVSGIRDLNFNDISAEGTVPVNSNFDPISNSYWKFANGTLTRETYDRENIISRQEAFLDSLGLYSHLDIVASENNVVFRVGKTISTLDDAIFEFPVTVVEPHLRTVKDGFLYFAYRPSSTAWHNIYRIRTDGTGFEELASDIPYLLAVYSAGCYIHKRLRSYRITRLHTDFKSISQPRHACLGTDLEVPVA